MDITPTQPGHMLLIERYGNGSFTLSGGRIHQGHLFLDASQADVWQGELSEPILHELLRRLTPLDCELLLLGTGKVFAPLSASLRNLCRAHRLQVDSMDTGAACRTYNVLASEGRRVAAVLIAI